MTTTISYPHDTATGLPDPLPTEALWGIAARLRAGVERQQSPWALSPHALVAATLRLEVNGRTVAARWDLINRVRDEAGRDVLGICETDPQLPGVALLSVNGVMVSGRPDLQLSTIAHEIGHLVFDVPSTLLQPSRRYRSVLAGPEVLSRAEARSERRANEFMGVLLVPPQPLHLRLVQAARAEGLRMVHAPHRGRPGLRVLAPDTPPEALAGVTAALAGDFGVSDRFIAVRLRRYRLIAGGL
jgi:hypothetical protein